MKKNKLINLSKINFLFIVGLSLTFFSCNKDDDIVSTSDINPTNKSPKYNNGIFFTRNSSSDINSKIHFFNLENKNIQEIYSSTTNHSVSIDGDETYYYICNQKIDNQGSNSILVKDVETFNDVTTITNNINYPEKVVSHNNKLFIINSDNINSFDTKPFISIFTKNSRFEFQKKVNLPEKTAIRKMSVFGNKLYLILSPTQSLSSKTSILVFNLQNEQIEANITLPNHHRPKISDLVFFENVVYAIISPVAFGFLAENEREIYKLSGTTLDLTHKITGATFGTSSVMNTYQNDFFATKNKSIYKRVPGSTNFELVYNNDLIVSFLHFITPTEFLVLDINKLNIKKLDDTSSSTNVFEFNPLSNLSSTTFFKI